MAEEHAHTWQEFAASLYDKLTGRGAEITYEFDNFELFVPATAKSDAPQIPWKMNGTVKIRTTDGVNK